MKNDKWIDSFKDPGAEYRPHPFWSWNDELDIDELKWQIHEMKKTGHGGFFMHARDGLLTPYMGEHWFKCIRACTEEAKAVGLNAWCYDEKGWPSGSAGGAIPSMGDKYKVHLIRLLEYKGEISGRAIAFYAVKDNTYRRLMSDDPEAIRDEIRQGECLMYAAELLRNDYIDLLNPEVVSAFINHTYEKYMDESEGELKGGALHGFFTDEPQFALCATPWSEIAEEEFKNTYGYDIVDHIPALFLGRDGYEDIRFDFWKMISRLFTESFAKLIHTWCTENSCKFTGHAMMEDNMIAQMHCTAGAMPMYEYMDIPGVDYLSRYPAVHEKIGKGGDPTHSLQVGSVSAQLGKKHVITETYALSGWDISFAEMRHLAEWQFLGGVNLMCQHLEGYSLRGERKNDYPPSMFYQSPWWSEYKTLNDTLSREGKLLADGVNDPGVLMLHPMHSLWIKYTNDNMNAEQSFDDEFKKATIMLAEAHVPFHYGDETIMSRHGSVEGDVLKIGKCSYRTVFLPSLFGIDRSTYELLTQFAKNGGKIITMGALPEFIDGRPAKDELDALISKCIPVELEKETLGLLLTELGVKKISVAGRMGEEEYVHVTVREYPEADRRLYFFLNFDKYGSHKVRITLPEDNVAELLCDTMTTKKPKVSYRDGMAVIDVTFEPYESHFFLAGNDICCDIVPEEGQYTQLDLTDANAQWDIGEGTDPNCCLLDYCHVGCEGVDWSDEMFVWNASKAVNNEIYSSSMPKIKFTFVISDDSDLSLMSDVKFTSEIKLPATVYINGVEVSPLNGEWFLDHQFTTYSIGDHLLHGENEIIITDFSVLKKIDDKMLYRSPYDFGFMYLTGSFGVFFNKPYTECENRAFSNAGKYVLTNKPESIIGGNIVSQGFPFFAGKMILSRKINAAALSIPTYAKLERPYAACARLYINGKPGELLAWGSFREDITSRLREGENDVAVEFIVGNRNLLGPHHDKTTEKFDVGPGEFSPWTPSTWRRRYCFVKAGLGE